MNIQAKVALDKEKRPEKFCPVHRCLWRTGGGYCPRHVIASLPSSAEQFRHQRNADMGDAVRDALEGR